MATASGVPSCLVAVTLTASFITGTPKLGRYE
jgi:hypothetical protein